MVRTLESVPFSIYFWFCNVCNILAIPTYRVYRLYDNTSMKNNDYYKNLRTEVGMAVPKMIYKINV